MWDDDEWRRCRVAMGDPDWARQRRWDTAGGRRGEAELDARVAGWTRTRTREEVTGRLRDQLLRVSPVLSIAELFDDPQLARRASFRALPHPVLGTVQCMSAPFTLSATPARQEQAGPALGADNDHVFGTILGLGGDERAALAREGVFD